MVVFTNTVLRLMMRWNRYWDRLMKHCPACGTQYTDNTIRFCLQDGSSLVESRETGTPTVPSDETPTVIRNRAPAELRFRREGGRWLIVGEWDVRVYYVN